MIFKNRHSLGDADGGQNRAVLESLLSDFGYSIAECDVGQLDATQKSTFADFFNTVTRVYEIGIERPLFVANGYGFQQ